MWDIYKKYSLHSIFTFYINRDITARIISSLYFNKKILKLLDCGKKKQNDVHIDTYHKPELIS